METLKSKQIATAKELGAKAFKSGICAIINSKKIGFTPEKEAKSTSLMKAWYDGWVAESLK